MTEFLEDTRRPTLPMTDSMEDSVPIGVALDLSSKDQVNKPIPSDDELDKSPGPLPGFWVLTHNGVLCSWWVVYSDAIKKGVNYAGLAVMESSGAAAPQAAAPAISASPFSPAGSSSAFGSSAAPKAAPAFGSSGQLGQNASPWGASTTTPSNTGGATFGSSSFGSSPSSSAFGKPSALGFGQASQLGMRTSPWNAGGNSKPAFGQSGFSSFASGGSNTQNPFGSDATSNANTANTAPATTTSSSGGAFSGFSSSQGGFASLGSNANNSGSSVFGSGSKFSGSPFGNVGTTSSSTDTAFPPPSEQKPAGGMFGSTPFKLESSFKPDPSQKGSIEEPVAPSGSSMFGSAFGSALGEAGNKETSATSTAKDQDMDTAEAAEETAQSAKPQSVFSTQNNQDSTTPTTTPAPPRFSFATSSTPGTSLFGQATKMETPSGGHSSSIGGGLFGTPKETPKSGGFSLFGKATPSAAQNLSERPKIKEEEQEDAPLPPDATSKAVYPLGDSSSSSAASGRSQLFGGLTTSTPPKPDSAPVSSDSMTPKPSQTPTEAPLPPDFTKTVKAAEAPPPPAFGNARKAVVEKSKPEADDAPLPPDLTRKVPGPDSQPSPVASKNDDAPLPPDFVLPKAPSKEPSFVPSVPDTADDESDLEEDDDESEGSGIDVAKDLSPTTSGVAVTPGFTPQSSFGGLAANMGGTTLATARPEERSRPLFGEVNRNAPLFPRPNQPSPRSPSPLRGAVPQRVVRSESTRSVSAPGMASQILGPKQSQAHPIGNSITSRERQVDSQDPFMLQHRRMRERQEAEETQPLVDEEDDEVQKVLASEVEGTLDLDEFIAHSNVAPPAKESVPSQVEAVYRDINSMIDTLGLNARAVKAFTKGHMESGEEEGRGKEDLEIPDDWVLCEIDELGEVLDSELHADLEDGRVQNLDDKLDACQDLAKDMQRLRAKQEDLKRVIMARMDPDQAEFARTLPLSAEQAAQQNELRRGFGHFTKLLAEVEEALTLLKTRIAAAPGPSGRSSTNVPTVEAVIRTISKMTTMAEKRSGDIDVLETQLRKMRLGSTSREASPMVTPQPRRSIMLSPDSTPSRNFRNSLTSSVMPFGPATRATPPRKKLSGFSKEEKGDLMEKRARRQAVLSKLKDSVEKRGVNVWSTEDIE